MNSLIIELTLSFLNRLVGLDLTTKRGVPDRMQQGKWQILELTLLRDCPSYSAQLLLVVNVFDLSVFFFQQVFFAKLVHKDEVVQLNYLELTVLKIKLYWTLVQSQGWNRRTEKE